MYPSVVLVFTSDVEGDLGLLIAIEQIHGSLDWVADACFQEAVAEEEDGVVQQLVDRTVVAGQVDEDDQVIFIAECAGAGNNFFKMVAQVFAGQVLLVQGGYFQIHTAVGMGGGPSEF